MLFGRFEANGKTFFGLVESSAGTIHELKNPEDLTRTIGKIYSLDEVKVLPPCQPQKIICVGLNYRDHAREFSMPVPSEPVLFLKPPTAVTPHKGPIKYPSMCNQLDYEAELAVVMGKTSKEVSPKRVSKYILGLTCANDITARDLQKKDGQWTRAKSFDTFLPLGPYINTDLDSSGLNISLYVNGEKRQQSNTNNLIFPVPELVSFISQIMTLYPGDVILTGTPSGVGKLAVGDEVTVSIDGIGDLQNYVIS
jgi:2-keto-4-pentenoate hydratase/2-oxohepta-3-ene-1,7-dioic acid hydratase in catechol pathway